MREIADLILPRVCPVCREVLSGVEQEVCLDCLSSLPLTYFWSYRNNPAEELFWGKVYFQRACSLFFYGDDSPYRRLIHELKYNGRFEIGILLGSILGRKMRESGLYADLDLVTAVPVSSLKQWTRGYNQAEVIAKALSGELDIKYVKGALKKRLFVTSQTTKNPQERWRNASASFRLAREKEICGRHILLVDDVLTTGATLEACGTSLLSASECRVSAATLAFVE